MSSNLWLAMVAQAKAELPDIETWPAALASAWPELPPVSNFRRRGNVLTFELGEATVGIASIPRPIPWEELEGPIAAAWYWPQAEDTLVDQQAHLLVTLLDEQKEPIPKSMLLTKIVAALVNEVDALGIFWGPGRLVHEPSAFVEQCSQMTHEHLPLYLWIDFRIQREADGSLILFTTGLERLGQPEIEVRNYQGEPQRLLEAVYNVAHYALDRIKPLQDGDTIGVSDFERLVVHQEPSMLDPNKPVIRLEF